MVLTDGDVAAIERATLAAVSPSLVMEYGNWLMALSTGSVRRAQSAVPLSHQNHSGPKTWESCRHAMAHVASVYRSHGQHPVFRLPQDHFILERAARELGLEPSGCYDVMVGGTAHLIRCASRSPHAESRRLTEVRAAPRPDAAWQSLFLGEGFDPVDGQCRMDHLSRSDSNRYFTAWWNGMPVACGAAAESHGWFSVHGMRTAAAHRGQGHASAVLRAMAVSALERGSERLFLQVESDNHAAVSLYTSLGLQTAWRYAYWKARPE